MPLRAAHSCIACCCRSAGSCTCETARLITSWRSRGSRSWWRASWRHRLGWMLSAQLGSEAGFASGASSSGINQLRPALGPWTERVTSVSGWVSRAMEGRRLCREACPTSQTSSSILLGCRPFLGQSSSSGTNGFSSCPGGGLHPPLNPCSRFRSPI